jgi:hypothetical protein
MKKSKKVHITKKNTIFHVKEGFSNYWGTEILTWDELIKKANFYYDGYKLHKIIEITRDLKQTQAHLTILTPEGSFKEKVRFFHDQNDISLKAAGGQPPIALYETGDDFLKDVSLYKQEKEEVLNKYKEKYKKAQINFKKEMDTLNEVLSTVEDYPEEFI